MYRPNDRAKPVEMSPGITRRTLVSHECMTLCEITLAKGAVVAQHSHHYEQAGYMARGRMLINIGGSEHTVSAGDGYLVPSGVPHEVTALEDSIAIDVFSPPREEYLDL